MKNTIHLHALLTLLCITSVNASTVPHYAVITQPVLDLNRHQAHDATTVFYPAAPQTEKIQRDHQGLINERVQVIETNGDAVKIQFDNLIYDLDSSGQPITTFWTATKYLALVEQLAANNLLSALANPEYGAEPTIVLIYPWNGFSVGTRLRHAPENDTQDGYAIVRIDYTNNGIVSDTVPHDCALIEKKPENAQQARQLFVGIINTFLDRVACHGVVPFVWGGSSFVRPYAADQKFYLQDGVWHREGFTNSMYNGYDASEFVWRMAQIAGIHFPYKTTWTMERSLQPLAANGILEDGDLIWVPGGLMIVSSVEKNEVVVAHGYTSGYGCIHKLKLSECLHGITTYADLVANYHAGKPLVILGKDGGIIRTCETFKLLKLVD
jgi:hypothetical protein